jgi:ribosomal protein L27
MTIQTLDFPKLHCSVIHVPIIRYKTVYCKLNGVKKYTKKNFDKQKKSVVGKAENTLFDKISGVVQTSSRTPNAT